MRKCNAREKALRRVLKEKKRIALSLNKREKRTFKKENKSILRILDEISRKRE